MKNWQTLLISSVISVVALAWVFSQADLPNILDALRHAKIEWIVVSYFMFVGLTWLRGLRWSILSERRLSVVDAFWLFNVGYLFNNLLPLRLGEIIRSALAGRRPDMQFGTALSTIVVERLFDVIAIVVQVVIVLIFLDLPAQVKQVAWVFGGGAVGATILLAIAARQPDWALNTGVRVLSFTPAFDDEKARNFLIPFVDGLAGVSDLRIFALGLSLSIVSWLASGVMGWVLMLAFFDAPPLIMGQLAVAFAGLGIAIPGAPSGVGTYHAAVVGALTSVNFDPANATSYAFLLHAASLFVPSIFGLIGLTREDLTFREAINLAKQAQKGGSEEG